MREGTMDSGQAHETGWFLAIPVFVWIIVLVLSKVPKRLDMAHHNFRCCHATTSPYFELLPCYNVLVAFKIFTCALTLVSYCLLLEHHVVAATHLGATSIGLSTAVYAILWRCFGAPSFGWSDVTIAFWLGFASWLTVYLYIIGLCGWTDSKIEECAQADAVDYLPGWQVVIGATLSGLAVLFLIGSATKNYVCTQKHRWFMFRARQPDLTLVTLTMTFLFGVSELVSGTLLAGDRISLQSAFFIVGSFAIFELPVQQRMMRIDSDFWSEMTFEPLLDQVAKKFGVEAVKPRHLRIQDLQITSEELGRGSFASVYRAVWEDTEIAVKLFQIGQLTPEMVRENCYELAVATSLHHENIVEFHGFSVSPPNMYLAMEMCEMTMAELLYHDIRPQGFADEFPFLFEQDPNANQPMVAVIVRRSLCIGLSDAIGHIHSQGYLHRDVKSDNCMVVLDSEHPSGCTCKLMDWGMAISLDSVTVDEEVALAKCAISEQRWAEMPQCGSLAWRAPEMIIHPELRREPYYCSKAADVYALGMVLVECITKSRPNIPVRCKLDPQWECPKVVDTDGFGMDDALLRLSWNWSPAERCTAEQLGTALRKLVLIRRTSNPIISERYGVHCLTLGQEGRRMQIRSPSVNEPVDDDPAFDYSTSLEAISLGRKISSDSQASFAQLENSTQSEATKASKIKVEDFGITC